MTPKFDYDNWKLDYKERNNPLNNTCPECGSSTGADGTYCQVCFWVWDEDYDGEEATLNRNQRHQLRKMRGNFD